MSLCSLAGVHDDACEVLFDAPFPEGSDLEGRCKGKCGAVLATGELLNLSKPHGVSVAGALLTAVRGICSGTQRGMGEATDSLLRW